jgi:hypothetical protein
LCYDSQSDDIAAAVAVAVVAAVAVGAVRLVAAASTDFAEGAAVCWTVLT